jgi:hypothetical protein
MIERLARAAAIAALVCLTATSVQSGPDATTNWLISDPVSALDFGIYRLEQHLSQGWFPIGGIVYFDWEANRLVISKFGGSGTATAVEAGCASWIQSVRNSAGLRADNGLPYGSASSFAQFFSHNGFERTNAPKNLYSDIDSLLTLNCASWFNDGGGKTGVVTITTPLLGTGYSVKKED